MPAPILATKLYIPSPRPQLVNRPHLIERLNEGLLAGHKLTLVSAAAGFGKTTLLSEWIVGCGRSVAWLSLEGEDGDAARFLTYIIAALQTIQVGIGEMALGMLQSSQPPFTDLLLTGLLNEIAALPNDFILVLDDYHTLDSQAVDQVLAFLLDHLPRQMHLALATREDPPFSLARLRARGQMTELRAADLRFTSTEAAQFLNRAMKLNLSDGDIAALEGRTEGWIAGLQLAALAMQAPLSMQGQADTADFIQSFTGSHHFVLDYLLEEVLQHQPEQIQTFLLRTSILNRLCGSLCDAVLDNVSISNFPSSTSILESLEHANLFIIPLDNERRWYRYHHLFGDLLRQRLGNSPELNELHLRASHWHEEDGDLAEGFHHALAAGDFERGADLAERAWQGMDDTFQTAAWLGWTKKLPEMVIGARPVLCVQIGSAFMDAGEPENSEIYLRRAEHELAGAADREEFKPLPGMIAMARAYNAQVQGDLDATVKYAQMALQLIPQDDFPQRSKATIMLEFTHWSSGDMDAALQAINNWVDSMQKIGNLFFVVASTFAIADILIAQGHLHEAETSYNRALQLAAAQGRETEQITAHHHLGLALLAHEHGNDETAAQHLQKAAELGQQTTLVDWPYRWHVAQARLKTAEGELEAALALLDEAKRVYIKNPVPDLRPVEALKAQVYLKQGRLGKAQAWARQRGLVVDDAVSYLKEFEYLMLARVLIAEHSFTGVNDLLDRLLRAAEEQNRMGDALEILLVQALAYQAQGNKPQALASLEHALTLAEPEGYLRIFVNEGEPMQLLIADLRLGIEEQSHEGGLPLPGYIDHVLASFSQPVAEPKSTIDNRSTPPNRSKPAILEPLTDRELEVLHLIAQGLSNGEISRRLFLALSTVKGHNLRIFGKLQVQNRTEAVARARELGLL